jgi:hypothetical protein
MTYIVFDGRGYETWIARSNDGRITIIAGWGNPVIINGKMYQTFDLEAGNYRFEVTIFDFYFESGKFYAVAALGDELPNLENLNQALTFVDMPEEGVTYSFTFELSAKSTVSVGFVGTERANVGAMGGVIKFNNIEFWANY